MNQHAGGIPLFEKIVDPPLIQQLKEMEQLGSVVRVALFARKLPKRASDEEPTMPPVPEDERPKAFDGLQADQLEQVGTLGMIKGFTFGVSETGEEVVRLPLPAHQHTLLHPIWGSIRSLCGFITLISRCGRMIYAFSCTLLVVHHGTVMLYAK